MKKLRFLSGLALASILFMSVDCTGFGVNNGGGGEDLEPMPSLQPEDQKVKLEKVAIKMLEKCPAEDMEGMVDLLNNFSDDYEDKFDDYDFSALLDFCENVFDESYSESYTRIYDEAKKEYITKSVLNFTIALANHKGEFTFGPNAVEKVSSNFNGVKLNIPIDGETYVAKLTTSGEVTTAKYNYSYYSRDEDYSGYYDEETGEYVYVDGGLTRVYDEKCNIKIDVPENIEVGIYDGKNSPVATVSVKMTKSFNAAGLDPSTDNFNAKITVYFNNGYEFVFDKITYDGVTNKGGHQFAVKKDGIALVSSSSSYTADIVNTVYKHEGSNYECEYSSVELKSAKEINVSVDILGEVQVKGKCSNAKEAAEAIENYYDALSNWDNETGNRKTPDEASAMRYLNNLNAKLDLGVYYNGSSQRYAKVEFEMDKYSYEWDDYYYYDLLPVIVFEDGSRYTLEDFFTEEAFDGLLDELEGFADDYDTLLGTIYIE